MERSKYIAEGVMTGSLMFLFFYLVIYEEKTVFWDLSLGILMLFGSITFGVGSSYCWERRRRAKCGFGDTSWHYGYLVLTLVGAAVFLCGLFAGAHSVEELNGLYGAVL